MLVVHKPWEATQIFQSFSSDTGNQSYKKCDPYFWHCMHIKSRMIYSVQVHNLLVDKSLNVTSMQYMIDK